MEFGNKRVLITAGPTWVPIDKVRVISNIATGQTGILLAKIFCDLGAKVTLILGPAESCCLDKRINLIRFNFFTELRQILSKELRSGRYTVVVHSAAVSDYQPKKLYGGKVRSDLKTWKLDLLPTPKIIKEIKNINPSIFLVGFKFGPGLSKVKLIREAKKLIAHSKADLVVANSICGSNYNAYIVSEYDIKGPFSSKSAMAKELAIQTGEALCRDSN